MLTARQHDSSNLQQSQIIYLYNMYIISDIETLNAKERKPFRSIVRGIVRLLESWLRYGYYNIQFYYRTEECRASTIII